jgi:hypothetical protein
MMGKRMNELSVVVRVFFFFFFKILIFNFLPCFWLEEMNKYYMDEDD